MRQFVETESNQDMAVSALARVEASAAICRLRKGGRLNSLECAVILDAIVADVCSMTEQAITAQVLKAAMGMTDLYSVRALDAIQLGSAIVVREDLRGSEIRFITSDYELLAAAAAEGFLTWDPSA